MKFSTKELILFASAFFFGFAIYLMGEMLIDLDKDVEGLKFGLQRCEARIDDQDRP